MERSKQARGMNKIKEEGPKDRRTEGRNKVTKEGSSVDK